MITPATWITIGRMLLALPLCWAILAGWIWGAFALLVLAALSDFADGKIARERGEVSTIGTALDPIADKIVVVTMMIALTAAQKITGVHLIAVNLIIAREVLISGLREATAGGLDLPVTFLAKIKTTVQFIALGLVLIAPSSIALLALWTAAGLTLWTGWQYIKLWVQSTRI
ncbi:MAG: CDP-alcohol phosphatidyltransferase family protein [Parvularcula sp.]